MYKGSYKIFRFLCILFLLIFINRISILQSKPISDSSFVDYISWPDSVLQTMSLEEKIAQLLIIRISSDKSISETQSIMDTIRKYQVGGVCFFQGGIARQALITNQIQKTSKIPLFVSIDAEWGLAMRLDSVELFPRQMALGAGYDTTLIYEMGAEIARQCKRMGIHINYASCIDVNCNSKNPVINSRSFGEDPHLVAACGIAYMKGMQDNGVLPVAKHFPGHGDTDMDSHYKLPSIKHSRQRLDTIELLPFQKAINSGIDGIMVGHLNVPALDTSANSISSTSKTIIRSLLIDSMHFSGLIITDGLEMKGIADYYPAGELEVKALEAGNDLLLLPAYPYIVIEKVKKAIQQGILTEKEINEKCLKVLRMKEKYVLPNCKEIDTTYLYKDINSKQAENIYQRLTESSITLLKNDNDIIPLQYIPASPIIHFRIDDNNGTDLETSLSKYIPIETKRITNSDLINKQNELLNYNNTGEYVIVSLHNTSQYPKNNYGLTSETVTFLDTLSKKDKIIFLLMGNPYLLDNIPFTDRFAAVIIAYHPVPQAEKAVAAALCGLLQLQGQLPITLSNYPYKTGILPHKTCISKIDFPEIDSLATLGIKEKAYPGCRILIAHKGDIIYNKSFGKHTYTGTTSVNEKDMYDLASITKVAATTLAIMKLYDNDKLKLNDKLSEYLPYLIGSNKEDITIAEVLTHTAGLKAWIPFYKSTLTDNKWNPMIYDTISSETFAIKVCHRMYMNKSYKDSMIQYIISSPISKNHKYEYSDLGFYLLSDLIQKISGESLDAYLYTHFYKPMGLKNITFNPTEKILLHYIPPTENDTIFRKQLIQGYVHDQGAAMMGGVSGHAGLFSSANDLYAILQMLLNEGEFEGKEYIRSGTIKHFTSYYTHNCRRGLGFDKPFQGKGGGPCSIYASSKSYGHSGFTGTFFWVDPKYDLIYIFLSNRVYPSADNQKLGNLSIRTKIQDSIYETLLDKKENED